MSTACENGHFEIIKWLITHGAATDVTRPSWKGKTPMDIACEKGHLNIVQHFIHHHRIPPDTLEQWHPRLSSSDKFQLHQAACQKLFDSQSFSTLLTIVCRIDIKRCRVLPSSSILRFRNLDDHVLLNRIENYICGGEETRQMWCLIFQKKCLVDFS